MNADLRLPPPLPTAAGRVWRTPEDARFETEVAQRWGHAFPHQRLHQFGGRDDIDFYVEDTRTQRMVAVAELKARTHALGAFPTVFLAMRKWLDLTRTAQAFRVAPLYIVRFADCLAYVNVDEVDASRHVLGGNARDWHKNDREPLIEIPFRQFGVVG